MIRSQNEGTTTHARCVGLSSSDLLFFVVSWYDSWLWKAAPVRQGCRPDDLLRLEQLTDVDKNTHLRASYYVPFHATVTDFHRINYRLLWFALADKIIKLWSHTCVTARRVLPCWQCGYWMEFNICMCQCLVNFTTFCRHVVKFSNWLKYHNVFLIKKYLSIKRI